MTEATQPTPKRKRKTPQPYNPLWKDSTRNQRQKERRESLKKLAIVTGYESWDKLATAALAGVYIELNKPKS